MIIKIIRIDEDIKEKIYKKHNILAEEIELILKENKPIFNKVGGDQYRATGLYNRYITIYFEYNKIVKQAIITTAYPSDNKQIKYYKMIRKG